MPIVNNASRVNGELYHQLASSSHYFFPSTSYADLEMTLYDFVSSALCGGPRPQKLPGLCSKSGRDFKNLAFAPHPYHCNQYLQCYYREDDDFDLAVTRRCPPGFFWDNLYEKCEISGNVKCQEDDCKHSCTAIPVPGNCRGYYECYHGRSEAKCCPQHYVFVPGSGCVEDIEHTCPDLCNWNEVTCANVECRRRPNWNYHGSYELSGTTVIPFNALYTGTCNNMEFDAATCECSVYKDHECAEELTFNFANPTLAQQIYEGFVDGIKASGVTLDPKGFTFVKGSKVHVESAHKYDNEPLTLRFRYREAAGSLKHDYAVILLTASLGCSESCRGTLMARATSDCIGFYITTPDGSSAHVDISLVGFDPNEFKEVTLVYDYDYMAATVKGKYQQYIETNKAPIGAYFPCGFDFGSTDNYEGFKGIIEFISLYSCTLPRLY